MKQRAIKKFKISNIEGPITSGLLEQFFDYKIEIELDPGAPLLIEKAKVEVRSIIRLDKNIVTYYVIEKLKSILILPGSHADHIFNPTIEETQEILNIDPNRVNVSNWIDIPSEKSLKSKRVFISCGQNAESEKNLGKKIAALVNEKTGLEGYFAENQQSLDGVTRNIFYEIFTASGFIAIMHKRDQIKQDPLEFRGSVWVEQEIAIAAFLVQTLGKKLPNKVYIEKGIIREGVRGYILLNPMEFSDHQEILADLETWWIGLKKQITQ